MAEIKLDVDSRLIGEIVMLLVTKGIPAGLELLARLKDKEITPEKVRALRTGLKPPERY